MGLEHLDSDRDTSGLLGLITSHPYREPTARGMIPDRCSRHVTHRVSHYTLEDGRVNRSATEDLTDPQGRTDP